MAIPYESNAGRNVSMSMGDKLTNARVARLGLSPRQQELNRWWAVYRCVNYDARKIDWDGKPHMDNVDHEAIATAGFIPPGFYDAGATFPIKFRRPTAPYPLPKVIVDRFTGLLFSERRHPQPRVAGDPKTEDFVQALAEASRVWQRMIVARSFGGATGTVIVGFKFREGMPVVEIHDPRWCMPDFEDRHALKLNAIEIRYQYPEDEVVGGKWEQVAYWYRRVIDKENDTVWKPIPVGDGEEPDWNNPNNVNEHVAHNLGFCPVIWVQNLPVEGDIDGDPDCHGLLDMFEAIDAEIAQAHRGTVANCDPTLHIGTNQPLGEVRKGSDNAIKTEIGGTVNYIEITGTGPKAAVELAEKLRAYALEVAQCVLEHPDNTGAKTATEVERAYSSMIAKADTLREQYGQKCVIPLMEMMVKAAKKVMTSKVNNEGMIERGTLDLPDRIEELAGGNVKRTKRELGPGGALTLQWPGYFEPSLTDIELATRAAGEARALGLIDMEHAAKFVSEYYRVDDVGAMLEKAKIEKQQDGAEIATSSLGRLNEGKVMKQGEGGDLQQQQQQPHGGDQ